MRYGSALDGGTLFCGTLYCDTTALWWHAQRARQVCSEGQGAHSAQGGIKCAQPLLMAAGSNKAAGKLPVVRIPSLLDTVVVTRWRRRATSFAFPSGARQRARLPTVQTRLRQCSPGRRVRGRPRRRVMRPCRSGSSRTSRARWMLGSAGVSRPPWATELAQVGVCIAVSIRVRWGARAEIQTMQQHQVAPNAPLAVPLSCARPPVARRRRAVHLGEGTKW